MENIPLVSFTDEINSQKNNYLKVFEEQLEKGEFIGGDPLKIFENNLTDYFSISNALGVGNGTDALVIALESIKHKFNIKKGSVIVPAFSFFATSEAIVKSGFKPIFVDVEKDTGNIDVKQIEQNIQDDTVGILPVHLFGKPADMKTISEIKEKYDLFIVEDVAQAFGGKHDRKFLGTIGDAGCFSFFPTKILGAFGDGGAIITNDNEIAEYANMLRNHGSRKKYSNEIFGYNSRLDSIQARFLDIKLSLINKNIESRRDISKYYIDNLKDVEHINFLNYEDSVFNYFTFKVPNHRDKLAEHLKNKKISTAIYYPIPLPNLQAHVNDKKEKQEFPAANNLSSTIISIPLWPEMDNSILDRIINEIKNFFDENIE